jgi:glycosyltransferase EpsE
MMSKEVIAGKISVIMGIYNCGDTLAEALDSILAQTYTQWNLIMCDDGSTDNTYAVAETYCRRYPEKMILLKNDRNMGLNFTLNRCLEEVDGEYVARMDGDDLSMPDRLEKEIAALRAHPDLMIVSTAMQHFDESGVWGMGTVIPFPQPEDFVLGTPFCHAPCLVRRDAYEAVEGYTDKPEFLRAEDYELWVKMYEKGYRGMNLEEPLYQMRDDRRAVLRRKFKYRITEFRVRCAAVNRLHLSKIGYLYALRPLLVGILPAGLYRYLHRKRLQKRKRI